jgi:lysine-N-methylase
VIDEKSKNKYKKVKGSFRRRLLRSINWKEGVFHQSEDKRCAFLNEQNLCDMYTVLGSGSLCKTCRLYPRHIEEFEGVREISLSLSCPEVAKVLLAKKEPVKFLSYEKDGDEEYEDFDLLLYSKLADAREVMIGILQDRTKPVSLRSGLVLAIAHDMHGRINREEIFGCDEVLMKYQTEAAKAFIEKKIAEWKDDVVKRYKFSKKNFLLLHQLELLKEEWFVSLVETEKLLYKDEETYAKVCQAFSEWQKEHLPDWEIIREQILVYFLFTYFCGAVYDGRIYGKIQMAAASLFYIEQMLMARFVKNEGCLYEEDIQDIVYRYSREVEHSDENLEKLEKLMEKEVWLCTNRQ